MWFARFCRGEAAFAGATTRRSVRAALALLGQGGLPRTATLGSRTGERGGKDGAAMAQLTVLRDRLQRTLDPAEVRDRLAARARTTPGRLTST